MAALNRHPVTVFFYRIVLPFLLYLVIEDLAVPRLLHLAREEACIRFIFSL